MIKFLIILLLFFPIINFANSNLYQFNNQNEKDRFYHLSKNLRCLVCQNQTIAESNAPLAHDLKSFIFKQIQSGQSDQQIIHYLKSRYGEFILYKPPLEKKTFFLWFSPLMLLVIAFISLFYCIRQQIK